MKLLYDLTSDLLVPYPRTDNEPVVGLDPAYLEMDLIQAEQPTYNPTTHRLEPTETIDLDARTVTRGWELIKLPVPPPPTPVPNWATFKFTALNSDSLNAILTAAFQVAPVAVASLAPALLRAEEQGSADFAAAWSAICNAVPVPPEVIGGFVGVATACHLPAEFINALAGGSQTE
jgi:hypothetical protein